MTIEKDKSAFLVMSNLPTAIRHIKKGQNKKGNKTRWDGLLIRQVRPMNLREKANNPKIKGIWLRKMGEVKKIKN